MPCQAQKTDTLWLRNGDRLVGEIKRLSRALLKYSTDDLGTVSVEWDKVDRLVSPASFEIEDLIGRLAKFAHDFKNTKASEKAWEWKEALEARLASK